MLLYAKREGEESKCCFDLPYIAHLLTFVCFIHRRSDIFDGSEKKRAKDDVEEEQTQGFEAIDLTQTQSDQRQELRTEVDDELDILEAYVDPLDFKTRRKKAKLLREIELEKVKMKSKYLTRFARQEHDPLKIWS